MSAALTYQEWLERVKTYSYWIKDIPVSMLTQELCEIAVKDNPYMLDFIPAKFQTETMCMMAITSGPKYFGSCVPELTADVLQYVAHQTHALCLAAVTIDGLTLEYVNEQTHDIVSAALAQNPEAVVYIKPRYYIRNGLVWEYVPGSKNKCKGLLITDPDEEWCL